jgi:hypothetical protein
MMNSQKEAKGGAQPGHLGDVDEKRNLSEKRVRFFSNFFELPGGLFQQAFGEF